MGRPRQYPPGTTLPRNHDGVREHLLLTVASLPDAPVRRRGRPPTHSTSDLERDLLLHPDVVGPLYPCKRLCPIDGKVIATIDPWTRVETPIPEGE